MFRFPGPARLAAAGALLAFHCCSAAFAGATTPSAQPPKDCDGRRSDLRVQATNVLRLPPDTDLRDFAKNTEIVRSFCKRNLQAPVNRAKLTRDKLGVCETSYTHIIGLINSTDQKIKAACEAVKSARDKESSCQDGQKECYVEAAKLFRGAAHMLDSARKAIAGGRKLLEAQPALHNEASLKYALHLEIIARVVEQVDREDREHKENAPTTYRPMTAAVRTRVINARVKAMLDAQALQYEGVNDFQAMLRDSGLSHNDTAGIRARVASIRKHAGSEVTGPSQVSDIEQFGPWSGEQFGARRHVQEFFPVLDSTDQRMGVGITRLEQMAVALETRGNRAGTIPHPTDPVQPSNQAVRLDQTRQQPGDGRVTTGGTTTDATPFDFLGGSRALPAGAAAAPASPATPSPARQQSYDTRAEPTRALASEPTRFSGRRLALSPGEATSLAGKMERPVSKQEKEHDEIRQPELFAGGLEGPMQAPAPFAGLRVESSASRGTPGEPSLLTQGASAASRERAPAFAEGEAPASDPHAQAFAERQVAQMEQGRNFGPSLRALLKKKLAGEYSRGPANAKAAAALFEELRNTQGVPGEQTGEEQLAAFEGQSETLFARVRSAHRRVLAKAKVAFH